MADRCVGFVFSGGGAKGSFSAGAVDYLIRERNVLPSIITGTSAGSICAAVLAQARSAAEFSALAGVLRDDIMRMSLPDATFAKQPWLTALDGTAAGDDITKVIRGKTRPVIPPDPTMSDDVLATGGPPTLTARQVWDDLRSLVTNLPAEHRALKSLGSDNRSLMLLDPLEKALRGQSPGVGPSPIDEKAIARPDLQLRLTITALNDGCPRFVTESGAVMDSDAVTPAEGSPVPGVIEGLLASSSVPAVFPARPIGSDVYVDGGVVMNIPLEPALSLGAQDVFLILADPLDCPPPTCDYSSANLFEVLTRAESTVSFYTQQHSDVARSLSSDVTMTTIDPTVVAVSTFETEGDLLQINMDYGWLRAAGETSELTEADRTTAHGLADRLTIGRLRSWYLDNGFGGSGAAHDKSAVSARSLVSDSLSQWTALGLPVPATASSWATKPTPPPKPAR